MKTPHRLSTAPSFNFCFRLPLTRCGLPAILEKEKNYGNKQRKPALYYYWKTS